MNDQPAAAARPAPEDVRAWPHYWQRRGMPWRTAPEIPEERRVLLAEQLAEQSNEAQGEPPFAGMTLTRADVEWLLATHESQGRVGPVWWDEERSRPREQRRAGLNLLGADLSQCDLRNLPSARLNRGGRAQGAMTLANADLSSAFLQDADLSETDLRDAQLRGARLEEADLTDAHLEGASLPVAQMDRAKLSGVHAEGARFSAASLRGAALMNIFAEGANFLAADLRKTLIFAANLQGANFRFADLSRASLASAHLEGATFFVQASEPADELTVAHGYTQLLERHYERIDGRAAPVLEIEQRVSGARLAGAYIAESHFEGTRLAQGDLIRIRSYLPDFPATLPPADLRTVFLDATTTLSKLKLSDRRGIGPAMCDVRWGGANLSALPWQHVRMFSDEWTARQRRDGHGVKKDTRTRLDDYETAVRANRQVAAVLRAAGLNEVADHFAYRAQICQRIVYRRQGRPLRFLGALMLDLISGYGYKPLRSLITYILVIAAFALGYFALGGANGQTLSWNEALVISMTAFHGRGFFQTNFQVGDPQAALAAIEALLGLLIEIVLIATFTQRFFAR